MPWLEPDINDAIEELAGQGVKGIVIVPLGFVSDHMEVVWDLDTEALETCAKLGLAATRVPTPGTHRKFVAGLVDLICERTVGEQHRRPAAPDQARPLVRRLPARLLRELPRRKAHHRRCRHHRRDRARSLPGRGPPARQAHGAGDP